MKIEFTVLGDPKALKRHRDRKYSVGKYDPSKGDKADFLAIAQQHAPPSPIEGSIYLELSFHFGRPKSHYRTGKYTGLLKPDAPSFHTTTPDADNLLKFVADALNKIFWRDDSLISVVKIFKQYDERPRTEVYIKTYDVS